MNNKNSTTKDLYYTKDHEWIDFQGSVAYIGVCGFKLIGFKEIQQLLFKDAEGFKKQGDILASIKYNDYIIAAHMPVDGKIIQINETLVSERLNTLLRYPESDGWLALIVPSKPYERKDLLLPRQYQLNNKSKYAK